MEGTHLTFDIDDVASHQEESVSLLRLFSSDLLGAFGEPSASLLSPNNNFSHRGSDTVRLLWALSLSLSTS